jgi:hypothetical protein
MEVLMKKLLSILLLSLALCPSAHASFIEEVKQLPGNLLFVVVTGVKLTDSGMHWLWDNVHNKAVHPLANALAETLEAATFETVDLNGNGS